MLGKIDSQDVRVYVVWVPSLPTDDESKVPAATAKIPDERASHYWDEKGALKVAYFKALKMSELAWDVYYVYGRDTEWKDEPPAPGFFMDQVGLPGGQPLDGDKLAAEMRRLLRQTK